jgi:hypothetical protein
MKSLYQIAVDCQEFIEGYVKEVLQPKYEYLKMNDARDTNVERIYYRAENVAVIFETPSGKMKTIEDLTIEQTFSLALALDCCEYEIKGVDEQ